MVPSSFSLKCWDGGWPATYSVYICWIIGRSAILQCPEVGLFEVYLEFTWNRATDWGEANLYDRWIQQLYVPDFWEQTWFQIFVPFFFYRYTYICQAMCSLIFWFRKCAPYSKDASFLSHSGQTVEGSVLLGIQRFEALSKQFQGGIVSKDTAAL